MIVKKGNYVVIDKKDSDDSNKDKDISSGGKGNLPTQRNIIDKEVNVINRGKSVNTADTYGNLGKGAEKSEISAKWARKLSGAMSKSGTLSEAARKILTQLTTSKPAVDWKRELKKFFATTETVDLALGNRRFIGQGDVLYGTRKGEGDALKTLILAVDTSISISQAQIKVFVNECLYLAAKVDIEKIYILYCDSEIRSIDEIKRGGKPDFTKIAGGGGTSFHPPFKWIADNKIKPTAFIYFTDSFAAYPKTTEFGINKYVKKIIWFICESGKINEPTFGKKIHLPMNSDGTFIKVGSVT